MQATAAFSKSIPLSVRSAASERQCVSANKSVVSSSASSARVSLSKANSTFLCGSVGIDTRSYADSSRATRRSLVVQASEEEEEGAVATVEKTHPYANRNKSDDEKYWKGNILLKMRKAKLNAKRAEQRSREMPDSGRMGPPTQTFDAIIEIGGLQQIVETGRYYSCNSLELEPGTEISLERVLAVKDGEKVHFGQPYVKGATVTATVLENYKAEKVIIYKMRPKKHTRSKNGHRQPMTRFMVTGVTCPSS